MEFESFSGVPRFIRNRCGCDPRDHRGRRRGGGRARERSAGSGPCGGASNRAEAGCEAWGGVAQDYGLFRSGRTRGAVALDCLAVRHGGCGAWSLALQMLRLGCEWSLALRFANGASPSSFWGCKRSLALRSCFGASLSAVVFWSLALQFLWCPSPCRGASLSASRSAVLRCCF